LEEKGQAPYNSNAGNRQAAGAGINQNSLLKNYDKERIMTV
jgi:hypothetical protein